MAKTKAQKQKILEDLKEKIAKQKGMVFIDFSRLKAKEMMDLRKRLKKENCRLLVSKKTLLKIALKNSKIPFWQKIDEVPGQLGVIFGFENEMTPAKIAYQFSQENENLKILSGMRKEKKYEYLTQEEVIELAKMPSREELLRRFIGTISSPIFNFINVLEGNIKGLIYLLAKAKI